MTNDKFRDAIDYHFGDRNDIRNKSFLGVIMQKRGFFNASNPEKREIQHQKLLDDAWKHLKSRGVVERKVTERRYVSIIPKGFSKHQIRDSRTGRIIRWER